MFLAAACVRRRLCRSTLAKWHHDVQAHTAAAAHSVPCQAAKAPTPAVLLSVQAHAPHTDFRRLFSGATPFLFAALLVCLCTLNKKATWKVKGIAPEHRPCQRPVPSGPGPTNYSLRLVLRHHRHLQGCVLAQVSSRVGVSLEAEGQGIGMAQAGGHLAAHLLAQGRALIGGQPSVRPDSFRTSY